MLWGSEAFPAERPASVIATGPLGCLGVGLPFALAAKIAEPNRTVVLLSGDGTFGLNGMEFDTACRHNIPVLCVIGNDQAWGMIKHGQELTYGFDRTCACDLGPVRYDKMVEALGGHGEFVEKPGDIRPALERALKSGKPACVNVLVDPRLPHPVTKMAAQSGIL
jgi:acetolactate synthase-1/2/3 large subunit